MITRPSTPQVLNGIVEELKREVLPFMPDMTAQIRVHMIIGVLEQCAGRAAAEIALMREEAAAYADYARRVADATGDAAVRDLVAAVEFGADLRLAAVTEEYARASAALAAAVETALDAGGPDLVAEGEQLLVDRIATEQGLTALATAGR